MVGSWKNPDFKGDFTQGEWDDKKANYPDLSWDEYRKIKKTEEELIVEVDIKMPEEELVEVQTKKYSFKEAYERDNAVDPEHYHFAIEPWKFIAENNLDFAQGNVIKYICRYKYKNGIEDLKKAKQYIDMLIDKELNGKT